MRRMRRLHLPFRHSLKRFMERPASIRAATRVIMGLTVATVFAGSIIVWLFDKRDFSSYGEALWFTLQTVTTVGYGDVTPTSTVGRAVGAFVMITAIGFITIVTAAITSAFVEAARRQVHEVEGAQAASDTERIESAIADLGKRLDRIERALTHEGDSAAGTHRDAS